MIFLSNLVNGISLGSIYAIIALGYTMVYGIAKMLNFAHGDIIMVGAYIAFCAAQYWGFPPLLALLVAMIVCTLLGITIEKLAYKPLRQATSLAVLITAIGMSYLLQNLALLIWGANPKSFPAAVMIPIPMISLFGGRLNISGVTLIAILANLVIMAVLTALLASHAAGAQKLIPHIATHGGGDYHSETAVIICPGGSYYWLSRKWEGSEVASKLNDAGFDAYVLEYRHAGTRYFLFGPLTPVRSHHYPEALEDVRAAVASLQAEGYRKIALAGFSAGGHLVLLAGEAFAKEMAAGTGAEAPEISCFIGTDSV